jgi:pimeloyl-ACP methyl ester carboxylesterase
LNKNAMPETARKLPGEVRDPYLQMLLDPVQYRTSIAEMQSLPDTFQQTAALLEGEKPLGDLPIIVLTAGQTAAPGATPFQAQQMAVDASQIENQRAMTLLSSRAEQRLIAESGHLMHLDAPEAVTSAVIDLLTGIR